MKPRVNTCAPTVRVCIARKVCRASLLPGNIPRERQFLTYFVGDVEFSGWRMDRRPCSLYRLPASWRLIALCKPAYETLRCFLEQRYKLATYPRFYAFENCHGRINGKCDRKHISDGTLPRGAKVMADMILRDARPKIGIMRELFRLYPRGT